VIISGVTPTAQATLTFTGTSPDPTGAPADLVFKLNVPGISLQNPNLTAIFSGFEDYRTLNYTFIGNWYRVDANTSTTLYDGVFASGFQMPASNVPTSGTAIYAGNSGSPTAYTQAGVTGSVFYGCGGNAICHDNLSGVANITVNFGSGTVNGTLSGMERQAGQFGRSATPWDDVNLTGTISGASLKGTTTIGTYNPAALSSSASGSFAGTLNGPNGEELGAAWTLSDTNASGVHTIAIGAIAATKQ
jgi:hypothetical protein